LNSISGLLYKNDVEKANYITEKYAKLLRHSLINSDNIITSFAEELEYIEYYLEIEKYRLEGKFTYTIDIEAGAKKEFEIPKMLVFTFAENAVKHGIRHMEGNGHIQLKLSEDRNYHIIEVMDNGIGIKNSEKHRKESTGTGLKTVDEILDYYKQIKKKKIYYEMFSLNGKFDNQPGTHVKISLPKDGKRRKK
jgi:sensor histidine kinase YesM